MKKKLLVIVSVIFVMAMITTLVSAQGGIPGSGWWSGEQVQNVSDSNATIMITAYDSASSATFEETQPVAPGAAFTFTPFNSFDTMPAGFSGSAVVSADQPIKAIVNVTNQPAGDLGVAGGKAAAQYQGTDGSAVANTLYFPLAKGDHYGKTSSFYIQNAGSASATGVVATWTMRSGNVHTYNVPSIGANKMVVISVFDSPTYNPAVNDDRVGSLKVTGTQPLAGVVMEHDTTAAVATVLAGTRAFTEQDFNTKAYAPVVKNARYGRFTGIQVQNVSAAPINITVAYKASAGCTGTFQDSASNVAPGASATFVQLAGKSNFPANCTGSATITANGDFVAIVNESETTGSPKAAAMYSAISASAATTEISIPLYKDNRYGATTGLQIQNVGNAAATFTATFSCTTGGPFTAVSDPAKTGTISAGGAFLFYTPSGDNLFAAGSPFSNDNVVCAVTVTSNQPVVAIANEGALTAGALDDNNYEGFNLTP
jgi:hypothetical protein